LRLRFSQLTWRNFRVIARRRRKTEKFQQRRQPEGRPAAVFLFSAKSISGDGTGLNAWGVADFSGSKLRGFLILSGHSLLNS
jgi:hypothetical protein